MDKLSAFYGIGLSVLIGLLIGLERGWKERNEPEGKNFAGIRTFTLVGLLGGIFGMLSVGFSHLFGMIGFLGLSLFLGMIYMRDSRCVEDKGITTEVALLLTFILGVSAAMDYKYVAAASAIFTTIVLSFKGEIHSIVKKIEVKELNAVWKFLIISVIVLPLLPNKTIDPWNSINLYEIWWIIVLIAGISFIGYFVMKFAGAEKGVIITGIFGGLVSSTVTTINFSKLAKDNKQLYNHFAAGIILACSIMFVRVIILTGVINKNLVLILLPSFVSMAIVILIFFIISFKKNSVDKAHDIGLNNPLDLISAIKLGLVLTFIIVAAEIVKKYSGNYGLYILSFVSGITDVDAITISIAKLSNHSLDAEISSKCIFIAAGVNSLVKGMFAFFIGGYEFGRKILTPMIAAVVLGYLFLIIF